MLAYTLILSGLVAADPAPAAKPAPAPAAQPAPAAEPAAGDLASLLAAVDEGYKRRDEPGKLDESKAKLEAAAKLAPKDYGVLWRLSRHYFWIADGDLPDDEK